MRTKLQIQKTSLLSRSQFVYLLQQKLINIQKVRYHRANFERTASKLRTTYSLNRCKQLNKK